MEPNPINEDDEDCRLCPLRIPLVVEKMMKNLDLKTLAECRLVCDQYRSMATSLLMKRNINHFQLTFSKESDCFYVERHKVLDYDHRHEKVFFEPLNNLNQVSTTTTTAESNDNESPLHLFCTEFHISGGSLSSSPDLRRFFSLHGHQIHKLNLNLSRDDVDDINDSVEHFRKLLLAKTPHLEHLHIQQLPHKWASHLLFSESEINWREELQLLQNLTILSVDRLNMKSSTLIGHLILMAQNLKELHNCPTPAMCKEDARLIEKMGLVKSLDFQPEPSNWELCCQLGDLTSNLTTVNFTLDELYACPESWPEVTRCINNIFRSSGTTLINFGTEQLGFLAGLKLPSQFQNVEKLTIRFWKEQALDIEDWQLFPGNDDDEGDDDDQEKSLSDLFPKVSKLKFKLFLVDDDDGDGDDEEEEDETAWGDLVSSLDSLPAVDFLEFRDQMLDGRWLVRFSNLCPFVTTLKIGTYSVLMFPTFCAEIGKYFEWVETLHLFTDDGYGGYDELDEDFTSKMDCAMTGFPADNCWTMRNVPPDLMHNILFNEERRQPSLLSLQYLTSLTIEFPPVPRYCECRNIPVFSHVTGIFGFGLMQKKRPQFRTKIITTSSPQMEHMMKEISPFVDSIVWKHE